jgi:hypothetical protein
MENQIVNSEFRTRITDTIQAILKDSFISGSRTQFKDMRGRLTFACPYCGDSSNDEHKKRGNLFWDSLQYHCYNAGCNKHRSLNNLLQDFGYKDSISTDERIAIINYIKNTSSNYNSKSSELEYDLFVKLYNLGIPVSDFYKVTKTYPIKRDGYGWDILKKRLLIHRSDEFAIARNKLVILNLTPDKKRVIGYQIRLLNNNTGNKYLSFNIEKLRNQAGLKSPKFELNVTDQEADKLNKLSTIFNILGADFTKTVTVFEGPIDSKFIRNSIALATAGRDLTMFEDIPDVRYLFDNDSTGKDIMRDLIKEGKYVFMWSKFIKDFELNLYKPTDMEYIKDMNDIIKICYVGKLNIYKYIDEYFTNNRIDSFHI